MGDEFLAKAKGFSRTFVIHSNANPYAATAAMGMMAARSQEAGPYFRPSDSFVPMVDGLAPEEPNANSAADQIDSDFKGDWVTYLRATGLPACGLKYKGIRSPEENTMCFLNAYNRRIPAAKPRTVHESRELSIPSEYRQNYDALAALVRAGGDLRAYLSRDVLKRKRPDRNDGLLNSWGIQHLHFRTGGTDQLLFCAITESDVFVIQTLPHNAEYLWVNTQLIQILHDNWPDMIARAKHTGLRPEVFRHPNANPFAVTTRIFRSLSLMEPCISRLLAERWHPATRKRIESTAIRSSTSSDIGKTPSRRMSLPFVPLSVCQLPKN